MFNLIITIAVLVLQAAAASDCPVTKPNGQMPPEAKPSDRFYGNGKLWLELWRDGTIVFRAGGPGFVGKDNSLTMKIAWWRGIPGDLKVVGRRMDAPSSPLLADVKSGYGDIGFQPTMLTFPAQGCWEVTGRVNDSSLTFITKVKRQ